MKLYFHHVGQKGASEDFKKTVYARVPISLAETSVPDSDPSKAELLSSLHRNFPVGSFNCWGVPSGAATVIRNLSVGDAVLLVESASPTGGSIPALGIVKTFLRQEYRSLSHALWGNDRYPYIFFFETEPLNMEWIDLVNDLGFDPKFDPRGNFYSVAEERTEKLGGTKRYVARIRTKRTATTDSPIDPANYLRRAIREDPPEYRTAAEKELKKILSDSERAKPDLTNEDTQGTVVSNVLPRDAAFRAEIRRIYGERCAVCGTNRYSPKGNPEADGAHIYPKRLNGRDVVENGISLCKLHHWAFDAGWFSLEDDLTILVRSDIPDTEAYSFITTYRGKRIAVPENQKHSPHPVFLREHRKMHGFE